MSLREIVEIGKDLGLKEEDLRNFVEEQQKLAIQKDREAFSREKVKEKQRMKREEREAERERERDEQREAREERAAKRDFERLQLEKEIITEMKVILCYLGRQISQGQIPEKYQDVKDSEVRERILRGSKEELTSFIEGQKAKNRNDIVNFVDACGQTHEEEISGNRNRMQTGTEHKSTETRKGDVKGFVKMEERICFSCGKKGHIAKHCDSPNAPEEEENGTTFWKSWLRKFEKEGKKMTAERDPFRTGQHCHESKKRFTRGQQLDGDNVRRCTCRSVPKPGVDNVQMSVGSTNAMRPSRQSKEEEQSD